MTYYERGYLNAVVKEPERTGDGTLWFPEENYFKAYYQPLFELFADEQPGELYGSSGGFEMELNSAVDGGRKTRLPPSADRNGSGERWN